MTRAAILPLTLLSVLALGCEKKPTEAPEDTAAPAGDDAAAGGDEAAASDGEEAKSDEGGGGW